MCGIVGIYSNTDPLTVALIEDMRDVFPYRGPDAKGHWLNQSRTVAFGHRRLSILDVSPAGNQPMLSKDKQVSLVFNGEIYNFLELKKELQGKGHVFSTGTDTEVLLASYLEWGTDCLARFNGMWAFAIWDERQQRLFIARDRLGIKPLYYMFNDGCFYFASEMKAILQIVSPHPGIQDDLIDSYMSFGYVPGEDTLVKNIKRMLPGHYMVIERDNTLKVNQYWDISFDNYEDRGFEYYFHKTNDLLLSAIDLRLRSDVPLGIFLSGGIDSSAVVGLLARRATEKLKTFSVAYDFGRQFNETEYARLVAEQFGTDHFEIFVTPQQFMNLIPEYVRLMDEPVTEAAAISLYFVSKLAKEQVTVVLSGEGSDEIFAGYDLYRYMNFLERYHKLLGSGITGLLAQTGAYLPAGNKLAKYLTLGSLPLEKRYKGISTYDESYKSILYSKEYAEKLQQNTNQNQLKFLEELFASANGADCLSKMLYFDTNTWLVDDLLIKADRMSMAASLELRVPFLDYRLVEFAATIPSKYKMKNGKGKYILKEMMKGILPDAIINRKKMGFPTPLKIMFENQLYDYARDILLSSDSAIKPYFKKNGIKKLLEEHISQTRDHHRTLWQMVVLETWFQEMSTG